MNYATVLDLPCAHGGPIGAGRMRATPEDFIVREWLGFAADGEGDHWLLTVRKRNANTHWVAKQLARLANIHPRDVGYAGLKDREAVADQAFTLPVRTAVTEWVGMKGDGFEVLNAARHRRKLKRGALRGNEFVIVVRDWTGNAADLETRMAAIAASGVPNYFGPQRFGNDLNNLRTAEHWFTNGAEPHDRVQRSFALSAARSAIFNAVLAERVRNGTWDQLVAGDIANLDGSGSIFAVPQLDDTLTQRCRELDLHPTGPMHGRQATGTAGTYVPHEAAVVSEWATFTAGLERAGLEQERRALRLPVRDLQWSMHDDALHLSFRLSRGTYATAVLHEVLDGAFSGSMPESDD